MVIHMKRESHSSYTSQNCYQSRRTSFSLWAVMGWNNQYLIVFISGHGAKGNCAKDDYIEQVLIPVMAKICKES
jgi:hypothetical protein